MSPQHIRVHDPAYRNAVDRARTETEGTEMQLAEGGAMMYSFCRVCEKDYKFEPEGLLNVSYYYSGSFWRVIDRTSKAL